MKQLVLAFVLLGLIQSCSYLPEDYSQPTLRVVDLPDYFLYYAGEEVPSNGFLMIPGGLVDPLVYECWIEPLVQRDTNLTVVLLRYPSNLAITNSKKAMKVMEELNEVQNWAVGGHSLGGVVAASLVKNSSDSFHGLIMLASWATSGYDLSSWEGSALSIYASEDGLSSKEEIFENAAYLPPSNEILLPVDAIGEANSTLYFEIEGGNHSGFGCYGDQDGDGEAFISNAEQQLQVLDALTSYFSSLW